MHSFELNVVVLCRGVGKKETGEDYIMRIPKFGLKSFVFTMGVLAVTSVVLAAVKAKVDVPVPGVNAA